MQTAKEANFSLFIVKHFVMIQKHALLLNAIVSSFFLLKCIKSINCNRTCCLTCIWLLLEIEYNYLYPSI